MSLEQALIDNTNTMKQLIAVLSTVAEDGGSLTPGGDTSGPAEGGKRKRRTKAEIEAETAAAAQGTQTAAAGVNLNTTGAAIYVILESSNTAAVIEPNQVIPSIAGLRQVSQAEYEAYKAKLAGSFSAAAQPTATPVAAAAPDFKSLVDRLMKIHAAKGNDGVLAVLQPFGATSVPALEKADIAQVAAKIAEVEAKFGLAQPAANSLFG